jgi:protocatechuate 3,4-dioxygenase alpha subunit
MSELACTPGQTVGPFFGMALPYRGGSSLVSYAHPDAVRLHGTVYDGAGAVVTDALVELWQPDSAGQIVRQPGSLRRDGSGFTGWGRAATDADGRYAFTTVRPGVARPTNAPFFAIAVFARGLLERLCTRAYLPGGDLDTDPLLSALEPGRRATLLCAAVSGYRFDIHLQGPDETVFLAYRDDAR